MFDEHHAAQYITDASCPKSLTVRPLSHFCVAPHIPWSHPAQPTTGVREVLEKFTDTEFTVEFKYDGERAQVHVLDAGNTVHIFSRCGWVGRTGRMEGLH